MSSLLFHREYLDGLAHPLVRFFEWWALEGPFPLRLTDGLRLPVPPTAARLDELSLPLLDAAGQPWRSLQQALFACGRSKAQSEKDTPHGRRAAVDASPARVVKGYCAGIYLPKHGTEAIERFEKYGALAKRHGGLVWGGDFLQAFPPDKDNPRGGDLPHVELPNWRELPYEREPQAADPAV